MKSRALRPLPHGHGPVPPGDSARQREPRERDAHERDPGSHDLNGDGNGLHRGLPLSDRHFASALAANDDDWVEVQILGRVAAGAPLLAEEHVIDTVRIDRGLLKGGREVFGLRVQGDSMIEAGILSGDYIFVKKQLTANRGEIVVAMIGDEATVKYYFPEKDHVRFQPANKNMAPIYVRAGDFKPTMLLGVVVGVFRRV
jgi:repressor LexA